MSKRIVFIIIKILLTAAALFGGLLALTNIKLNGFSIGSWEVSAEAVQMFVDTAGSYFFWIYAVIVIFLIWRKWVKRKGFDAVVKK